MTSIDRAVTGRAGKRRFGRPVGIAAACVAVLAIGFGAAVWKSQDALPGDSLYGLKRAGEDVRLSLISGDTDRGHAYLSLATTRVDEARDLLGQNSAMAAGSGVLADGMSAQTVSLIRSTLAAANSDLQSGSDLLGTAAVHSHSASPLSIMTSWAPVQLHKLHDLAVLTGTGAAHTSALQSWTLVDSALHRARTLAPQITNGCHSTGSDELGPVACAAAITPSTTSGARGGHSSRHTSSTHHGTGHASSSSTPDGRTTGGTGRDRRPSGTTRPSGSPSAPHLPTRLPTSLPTTLPSLPVAVGSCGVSASIGPIGVQLGSCPSGS